MTDLEKRLRARIDAFVDELTEIVREEALEQVARALGGAATRVKRGRRGQSAKGARGVSATNATSQAGSPSAGPRQPRRDRKRAPKRTEADLVALETRILRHVSTNAGTGAREIAAALGLTTADITLPLRRLVGDRRLKTEGIKRGTRYHSV